MRILHVTNTYLPVRNGVTVSVAGWVAALREAGHEVAVWTVAEGAAHVTDEVYSVAGAGALAHGFPLPLSLRPPAAIRARTWDVVHAHHPVLLGPAAARLARSSSALLAATAHSDYVAYLDSYAAPMAGVLRPVVRANMRRFFDRADVVFAPSEGIERALTAWGVRSRVVGSTYPVDITQFAPLPRAHAREVLGIPAGVPLALYAGRLAADKRVLALLDEFAVARRRVRDAMLAIVGGGPLAEKVAHAAAKRFGDAVILTGALSPEQLGQWYSAADVFVSASSNEVGPLATIEAGLCGTATVAMAVPGFSDRIADGVTGLLAVPMSGALGEALGEALADRASTHLMGVAAATAFGRHTPHASARSLVDSYTLATRTAPHVAARRRRPQLKADTD